MSSFTESRWRVLPVGPAATLLRSAREAMFSGLVGLGGLSLVIFLGGLVTEEVASGSAAGAALDLVSRASLGSSAVIGSLGLFVLGMLGAVEGLVMARALAAARRRGIPATRVPVPEQWDTARSTGARRYRIIAITLLVVLGCVYLVAVLAAIEGSLEHIRAVVILGGALLLAAIWAGIPVTSRILPRRKEGLLEELTQHWTRAHRGIAASQELTAEKVAARREAAGVLVPRSGGGGTRELLPGRRVRRLRNSLFSVVILALVLWSIGFRAVILVAYPGSSAGSVPRLAERADLGPGGERLVDLLAVGSGIAAAVGLLAVAVMVVCTIVLRRIEHRVLRRALADRTGPPPPHELLSRAMARTSLPVLKVLFAVAGAGTGLGGALWFVSLQAGLSDGNIYTAADPQLRAVAALGPWLVLASLTVMALGIVLVSVLDARDRGLRDELVQRWPVRAEQPVLSVLAEVVLEKKGGASS